MVPFVSPLSRPACSTTPTKLACLMYHRHNLCHHQLQHRRALHVVFIVVIFVKKLANIVKIVRSPNPTQLCSIAPKLFLTEWQYFRKKQWIRIKRAWHLVLIVVGAWGIFCSQLRNESNHLWLTSLALPPCTCSNRQNILENIRLFACSVLKQTFAKIYRRE